jgi:hypothetical protein
MEHNNNTTHAQTMQAHIAACKASSLTVKAYCQQHKIKTSNYYYWQCKLQPQPTGKFIPITSPPVTAPVIIIFNNGTRICFENMPPADYVKNLVH